jgi:transcriptional regulator with XRE-family HTH domain
MLLGIDNNEAIGAFLKTHRDKRSLSQKQVSDKLGYSSAQFISNIERGVAPVPSQLFLELIGMYKIPDREILDFLMEEQKKALTRLLKRKKKSY